MRVGLLALLFVITIFVGRLFQIQGLDAAALAEQAVEKRTVTEQIPAHRGDIVDRDGAVLATTLERRNITLDQNLIHLYKKRIDGVSVPVGVPGAAADLAVLLGESPAAIEARLVGKAKFKYLVKDVTPETWRRVSKLAIPGVFSQQASRRTYPAEDIAAATLGFTGKNGIPLGGLELAQNSLLAGKPGSMAYERSMDGLRIPTGAQSEVPPTTGKTIRLTLGRDLQWKTQTLLADAVARTRAEAGYAVVQDVRTGDVLAMASAPTFDANNPSKAAQSDLLNRTITEVFEPGSTSKVVTAAAALEEGVVKPSSKFAVQSRINRGGKTFNDSHAHGRQRLTFAGVIAQSSNVGTIMAGERVPPGTLYKYMKAFGLGEKTGLGPGESAGIVAPPDTWSDSQRYTVLFGQGLAVTAVQSTSVFATIANGGVHQIPRLIDATIDPDGDVTPVPRAASNRVVSVKTARQLSRMLENVVGEEGTAEAAKIAGYRVAGKTGTAQAPDSRCGCYRGYTASFIGFAPADDPRLVVSVILQRPTRGHYGGVVAAPVFQKIMTYALAHEQIPPSGKKAPKMPTTY